MKVLLFLGGKTYETILFCLTEHLILHPIDRELRWKTGFHETYYTRAD